GLLDLMVANYTIGRRVGCAALIRLVMNRRIYFDSKQKSFAPVLLAPTIADMNTPPELREQLRESREQNRGFLARLDLIAEIITCQDEEEEDQDEDPKEEGDEKEEEEGEEDSEEGDVDKYYLGGGEAAGWIDRTLRARRCSPSDLLGAIRV